MLSCDSRLAGLGHALRCLTYRALTLRFEVLFVGGGAKVRANGYGVFAEAP